MASSNFVSSIFVRMFYILISKLTLFLTCSDDDDDDDYYEY